jgi:hypothetical protein
MHESTFLLYLPLFVRDKEADGPANSGSLHQSSLNCEMLCLSLLVALLFTQTVVSQSCYAAANKRIGSAVVPCGDTSDGSISACCALGDICLR